MCKYCVSMNGVDTYDDVAPTCSRSMAIAGTMEGKLCHELYTLNVMQNRFEAYQKGEEAMPEEEYEMLWDMIQERKQKTVFIINKYFDYLFGTVLTGVR